MRGLARLELHTLEGEKTHALFSRRFGEVELRHVRADALAGVGHHEVRRDRVPALETEVLVVERRVTQAVAEGVHRLEPLLREPAVANLRALVVFDRDRCAPG